MNVIVNCWQHIWHALCLINKCHIVCFVGDLHVLIRIATIARKLCLLFYFSLFIIRLSCWHSQISDWGCRPGLVYWLQLKAKSFPYSLPSVGPGADPSVQAVSSQVIHPAVGCHYFPPSLRLPSQLQSISAPWPVPSYTAWWQKHIGVNNLPKVLTQLLPRVGFEPTTCWLQVQCCCTRCASCWL